LRRNHILPVHQRVWFVCVILICFASLGHAQSVTLTWDAPAEPQLGFNVYRSNQPGAYSGPPLNWPALLTTNSFTDFAVEDGQKYYYVVTAVGAVGTESPYSNEVEAFADSSTALPAFGIEPTFSPGSGLALIRHHEDRRLISEVAIPATPLIRAGRFYVEFRASVNTGIVLVNPNAEPVAFDFYLTDEDGRIPYWNTFWLNAGANVVAFLNEPPFSTPEIDLERVKTLTFSSSAAIWVTALRGVINDKSDFLMTPLPVSTPESVSAYCSNIPYYLSGGPWKSRTVLVNPVDAPISGTAEHFITSANTANEHMGFTIPARSAITLETTSTPEAAAGWVRINAADGSACPSAFAVFSSQLNDITHSELGVTASPEESPFRLYVELSADPRDGIVRSGFVVTNSSDSPAPVDIEVLAIDGADTGLRHHITVPPMGQITTYVNEWPEFSSPSIFFMGFLRFSGTSVSAVGVKRLFPIGGESVYTTSPTVPESVLMPGSPERFAFSIHLPGYVTRFVYFKTR
jgi:hypothetical protein